MCGFIVLFENKHVELQKSKFSEILNFLSHRGPDAQGFYFGKGIFMGHRRLSIIDLSKKANQPMKRDNLVIVFNGEIYNYKDIRKKLSSKGYKFLTNSDTEVLLFAYKEWGKEFLNLLRGMFAFCIYDENKKELFCARDRIGEKPLIYAETDKGIIISSEIKPILESGLVKKEIQEEFFEFLKVGNYKQIPDPFTIWKGIRKLKPGSYFIAKNGKIIEEKFYWYPNVENYEEIPPKKVKEAVIEAIELNSVSDVPISVLLSGGTDSSIVAFVLKKVLGLEVMAFTFGRDERDEEIHRAKRVAEILKIPIKVFYFNKEDIKRRLEEVISLYCEPLTLLQFAYGDLLYENVRKEGFKVVLTGNGADELFYGYTAHPRTFLISLLLKALPFNNIFWSKKRLLKTAPRNVKPYIELLYEEYEELLRPFLKKYYIDFSNFWGLISENNHSITMIGDIPGMKNSVEVRNPFLDYKLVELAYTIHPKRKFKKLLDNSGKFNKWILKEAFKDTPIVEIFTKNKIGFGFNIGEKRAFGSIRDLIKWSIDTFKKNCEEN